MAAFNIPSMTAAQVAAVISACGVLAAYILGESEADAAAAKSSGPSDPS